VIVSSVSFASNTITEARSSGLSTEIQAINGS